MPATVTIDGVEHTITKLETGNILVEHPNGQYSPMHGPDTDGTHRFEVHPCQTKVYESWNAMLPADEQTSGGPGKDGAEPPWSVRKARTDRSNRPMEKPGGRRS